MKIYNVHNFKSTNIESPSVYRNRAVRYFRDNHRAVFSDFILYVNILVTTNIYIALVAAVRISETTIEQSC